MSGTSHASLLHGYIWGPEIAGRKRGLLMSHPSLCWLLLFTGEGIGRRMLVFCVDKAAVPELERSAGQEAVDTVDYLELTTNFEGEIVNISHSQPEVTAFC